MPPNAAPTEAEKFHAETLTTSFLSRRLRQAKGAATMCDRCRDRYGKAVLVTEPLTREWLCGPCLGEPPSNEKPRF